MIIFMGFLNLVTIWSATRIDAFRVPFTKSNVIVNSDGVQFENPEDIIPMGTPECANCTKYLTENAQFAFNYLASMEPNDASGIGPCYNFEYQGRDTLSFYGDACVKPVKNKPNFTDTTLYLRYGLTKFVAECMINVSQLTGGILGSVGNAGQVGTPNPTCDKNDVKEFTEGNVEGSTYALFHLRKSINSESKCMKLQKEKSVVMRKFNITIQIINATLEIVVQRDKSVKGTKGIKITKVEAVKQNFEGSEMHCDGDGDVDVCDCFFDTEFTADSIQELITTYITCNFKADDSVIQFVAATYGDCSKFVP